MAKAQGATEYLVLLAVVLIVALVSVALLGFFPGMASDSQIAQSQAYWQSASPIAITEMGARYTPSGGTSPYFRIRNTGAYPIRITKVVNGAYSTGLVYYKGSCCIDMSPYMLMSPGEELFFGYPSAFGGLPYNNGFWFPTAAPVQNQLGGATSHCMNETPYGNLVVPNFGFEYIEYIEGQQITKREMGKPIVIKCLPPS
jgi:hypothetical protein